MNNEYLVDIISSHSFERGLFYLFVVFLDVVESEGKNLYEDVNEDFLPVVIL